ncbi:MAG: hypothetical protein M0R21_10545 [Lentimicrobiaceae bacterium]|nr:hypothetical protein [Lentimicrobiaceae bacterium]
MGKIGLLLIMLLFCIGGYAQDGNDSKSNMPLLSPVKARITSATGWAMMSNGKWKSATNKIPYSDPEGEKPPEGKKAMGMENFDELEMREIAINNKNYNILIIKYQEGTYRFPSIQQDWTTFKTLDYYMFLSANLKGAFGDSQDNDISTAVALNPVCSGSIDHYNDKDVEGIISAQAFRAANLNYKSPANLIIAMMPHEEKGRQYIRFKFIKSYSSNYLVNSYMRTDLIKKHFLTSFWETDFNAFKNFWGTAASITFSQGELTHPTDYQGYFDLAMREYGAADYIGAVADFNKAFIMNPNVDDYIFFATRANAKHKLGDYIGAVNDFDQAIHFKPAENKLLNNWARCYFNRGVSKFFLNDKKGACYDWQTAKELNVGEADDYIKKYCK